MNSSRRAYEKRFDTFKQVILAWKSENEIFELYEKCHTPGQVISLFRHCFLGSDIEAQARTVLQLKDSQLIKMLRGIVPYSKQQHKRHLAMPQWWKIRFRHLDKSEEDVKRLVESQLQQWASKTHNIRRKKSTGYNPKQTIEYWINQGLSNDEAHQAFLSFTRACSPFTVEFWKRKGLTDEQAQEKATSLRSRGGIAACTSLNKKFVSKLESDILDYLQTRFTHPLKKQHCIDGKFVYDICDLKKKKIIEVNGTYWHADSRVYPKDDMIVCNGLTVAQVHARDVEKTEHAKKFGYEVLVVWEIDWHANKHAVIQKMIEFLT
jgi:very-short-patch-repair endonuclease